MSNNLYLSPICNVNDDILLRIFTLNADMFSDREALHTTCITSQVCRPWGHLMLNTTSIWAKLIDMDHISKRKTNEWREELIRRSGIAPLWIRAEFAGKLLYWTPESPHDKYIVQFFIDLVRLNYHRIQKLVILPYYTRFRLPASMLRVPPPQLEHCEISFIELTHSEPLFDGDAPMLRIFRLRGRCFDPLAPWLRHLRSILLDIEYHLHEALAVLAQMHNLEELTIQSGNFDPDPSLPMVYLSYLKYLEYSHASNSDALAALMDHLRIPAECSLIIRLESNGGHISPVYFPQEKLAHLSVINIFMQQAEHALGSRIFEAIDLDYKPKVFISFTCRTTSLYPRVLRMTMPLCQDSSSMLTTFLKKLIHLDFTKITKIKLNVYDRLNQSFRRVFDRLPFVEHMSTNLRTLSLLEKLQKKPIGFDKVSNKSSIMFPSLKVIDLHIPLFSCLDNSDIDEVHAAFFLWRLKKGYPVSTVDITPHLDRKAPPDVGVLDEVEGLKFFYMLSAVDGIIEYTCGRHNSERHMDTK